MNVDVHVHTKHVLAFDAFTSSCTTWIKRVATAHTQHAHLPRLTPSSTSVSASSLPVWLHVLSHVHSHSPVDSPHVSPHHAPPAVSMSVSPIPIHSAVMRHAHHQHHPVTSPSGDEEWRTMALWMCAAHEMLRWLERRRAVHVCRLHVVWYSGCCFQQTAAASYVSVC